MENNIRLRFTGGGSSSIRMRIKIQIEFNLYSIRSEFSDTNGDPGAWWSLERTVARFDQCAWLRSKCAIRSNAPSNVFVLAFALFVRLASNHSEQHRFGSCSFQNFRIANLQSIQIFRWTLRWAFRFHWNHTETVSATYEILCLEQLLCCTVMNFKL